MSDITIDFDTRSLELASHGHQVAVVPLEQSGVSISIKPPQSEDAKRVRNTVVPVRDRSYYKPFTSSAKKRTPGAKKAT